MILSSGVISPVLNMRLSCVQVVGALLNCALLKHCTTNTGGKDPSWITDGHVEWNVCLAGDCTSPTRNEKGNLVSAPIQWILDCIRALLICTNDIETEVKPSINSFMVVL